MGTRRLDLRTSLNSPSRPDHAIDGAHVYSTLVHEIHHAMRWRGPGCGSTLRERLVSEGLAQTFEAECTGVVPLYAEGEVSTSTSR